MIVRHCEPRSFEFEELLERCLGNVDFAERVVRLFSARFADDLDQLEQHLQAGDDIELARLAHAMKGACANIAAPGLRQHAARIEELARRNRLDQIDAPLANLRDEWERFSNSLAPAGLASEGLDCV